MGWYGTPGATKEDVVAEIQTRLDGRIIDQAITHEGGNTCLWVALRSQHDKHRTGIMLYLVSKSGGCWGYKPISEDMEPYYYSCPRRLLTKTEGFGGYSYKWRTKVLGTVSKGDRI